LYSAYLDTIFPDSKIKDIVYHGTRNTFDKFEKKNKEQYSIENETQTNSLLDVLLPPNQVFIKYHLLPFI